MVKLKPCPFCGSEPKTHIEYIIRGGYSVRIQCSKSNCNAQQETILVGCNKSFDDILNAIDKVTDYWNVRVYE